MARRRELKTSFVSGEISPSLIGRTDIQEYSAGASRLENVYVTSQGGVRRREGLLYIDATNDDNLPRLLPFVFSTGTGIGTGVQYLLVLTNQRVDIYRDDTLVHTLTGSIIDDITTARLFDFRYTQSQDSMFIVHPDVEPFRIVNGGNDTTWTVERLSFTDVPTEPFGGITSSSETDTLSFTETPRARIYNVERTTGTFSFTGKENQQILFRSGVLQIIEVVSASEAVALELVEPANYNNTNDWIYESGFEPVWSASRGWPQSVTFHQGRLVFGGTKALPQFIFFSRTGDFFSFRQTGLDDGAIVISVDSSDVPIVTDLFSGRALQIFTTSGEFWVRAASATTTAITPGSVSVENATKHGTSGVRPLSVDGATVFVERGGRNIRDFIFNEVENSFIANNISILAQHLVKQPVNMALRRASGKLSDDYVYIVNSDGSVSVMNVLRSENILAFSRFSTDGNFKDVVAVDRSIYFAVERDGGMFIEKLDEDSLFDASVIKEYDPAQTTFDGLDHLEGVEISILRDGFIETDKTVASGEVELDEAGEIVNGGLGFTVIVQTLPITTIKQSGFDDAGEFKRVVKANLRLSETRSVVVERVENNGRSQIYRPVFRSFGSGVLDQPVSLFTGPVDIYLGGINRDVTIKITQDQSSELNILSMAVEVSS